ncbi:MAG: M15 family metallopeptidase [Clostridia bacterium]|nr:M15 family metallopeptidase [Clostridia bacterium]
MKKIVSLILAVFMALTFASCGASSGSPFDTESDRAPESDEAGNATVLLFSEKVNIRSDKNAELNFYGEAGKLWKIEYAVGSSSGSIEVDAASREATGVDAPAVSDDSHFRFFSRDINYDGNGDFAIQSRSAIGDVIPYYVWLWNETGGSFVFEGELENPIFSPEESKIYCTAVDRGIEYLRIYDVANGVVTFSNEQPLTGTPTFKSDLSSYEEYMAPADRDGYLILVNSENAIGENYIPKDLTNLVDTRSDRAAQQMTKTAAKALEAMYIEMRASGYTDVSVTSAYRSYTRQKEIFDMYLNMNLANGYDYDTAYAMVASDTALPGQSEHQTGLCCDMHNLSSASQAFANQEAYKWLKENCWKFGFILRYPDDKEDITKITFEPWHYRFVGRYHAAKMRAMGLCLEEYVKLLDQ